MNKNTLRKKAISLTATIGLITSALPLATLGTYNGNANAATVLSSPNFVYLSAKSSVKMLSADIVPNASAEMLVIKLRIYNNETKPLNLLDYWFRLKDKSGKPFKATLLDDTKKSVNSKGYTDLTYTADVGDNRKVNEFVVECVKWDFSAANYERVLGKIVIPANYSRTIPFNQYSTYPVGSTTIKSSVESATSFKQDDVWNIQLELSLMNTGKWSTTLGQESVFYLRTQQGYIYSLKPKTDSTVLLPQQTKKIVLTGTIPSTVDLKNSTLLFGAMESKSNVLLPYATYQLPSTFNSSATNPNDTSAIPFTQATKFTIDDSIASIVGSQILRYPNNQEDLVSATFKVTLTSGTSVAFPQLEGSLSINGVPIKRNIQIATADPQQILYANKVYTVSVLIPVTDKDNLTSFALNLSSKNDQGTQSIANVKLAVPTKVTTLTKSMNQTWISEDQSVQFNVTKALTYSGQKTDIVLAEVDYSNQTSRTANVKTLRSYLVNKQGNIYPAIIKAPANASLRANGVGKITVYAEIPKNVGFSDLQLFIGEEVSSGEIKNLLNPVSIPLTTQTSDFPTTQQMSLGSDILSIRNVAAQLIDGSRFNLDFKYDLVEGLSSYEWDSRESTILFEIVDAKGAIFQSAAGIGQNAEKTLEYGKDKSYLAAFNDVQLMMKVPQFGGYTLNVYEQFEGHNRLIGTKPLEWFVRSTD